MHIVWQRKLPLQQLHCALRSPVRFLCGRQDLVDVTLVLTDGRLVLRLLERNSLTTKVVRAQDRVFAVTGLLKNCNRWVQTLHQVRHDVGHRLGLIL